MRPTLGLPQAGLLAAGLLTAPALAPALVATLAASLAPTRAHAAIYTTSFSGTVTQQNGAGLAIGSTVSGLFNYSTDANRFLSFTLNTIAATPPYSSTATVSPAGISNPSEAIYSASTSIAQGTGSTNTAFTLDLLAFNTFTSPNALAILTTPGLGSQLETQANSFDGSYSAFSYYTGTQNTVTRSFTAALNPNSLTTLVPEPTSLLLITLPVMSLALRRRR